jgi:hypothetical protein
MAFSTNTTRSLIFLAAVVPQSNLTFVNQRFSSRAYIGVILRIINKVFLCKLFAALFPNL